MEPNMLYLTPINDTDKIQHEEHFQRVIPESKQAKKSKTLKLYVNKEEKLEQQFSNIHSIQSRKDDFLEQNRNNETLGR